MKKAVAVALSSLTLSAVIFASAYNASFNNRLVPMQATDTYSFGLGVCTQEEIDAKEFARYTDNHNPITFKFGGAFSYYADSVVTLQGGVGDACFYNYTPINGLKSIRFDCVAAFNRNLKVYYGETLDAVQGVIELTSADFVDPNGTLVEFPDNAKYFSIVHNASSWNVSRIKNVTISYSCADNYRGEAFALNEHVSKPLSNLPLTDNFVFDIKFTSASSTRINFMLGDGWSNFFGYFAIYGNGGMGKAYSGVNVKHLSDGYLRITVVPAELTEVGGNKENITKFNLFYIRGDWSDATGYVDLLPTVNPFEMVSETKSITNVNTTRHIGLDETFIIDWRFEPGQDREYIQFSDNDWYNYYGIYGQWVNSTTGAMTNAAADLGGVTVEVVGECHYLIAFNISELTVVTGDKTTIEYINLIFFGGNQTGVFTVHVPQ